MKASVILPVYNAGLYLAESITSILNQTFSDFELLILNDGSTDNSLSIIQSFDDNRIKLIHSEANRGLVYQLNLGIELAKGKYIIRMDADDVCMPNRFRRQVDFMDKNEHIGICGSWIKTFGKIEGGDWKMRIHNDDIRFTLLFGSPFAHFGVIIRREILLKNSLFYNAESFPIEDYELWSRLLKVARGANIPEFLTQYRTHECQVSEVMNSSQNEKSRALRSQIFEEDFFKISNENRQNFEIFMGYRKCNKSEWESFSQFIEDMCRQNKSGASLKSLKKNVDRILLMRTLNIKDSNALIRFIFHKRMLLRMGLIINTILVKSGIRK